MTIRLIAKVLFFSFVFGCFVTLLTDHLNWPLSAHVALSAFGGGYIGFLCAESER